MSDDRVPHAPGADAPGEPTAAELIRSYQGRARKRFGQHFLTSDSVIARIVETCGAGPEHPVLEVGPGPGVLTAALLASGARVTAVELDRDCVEHLEQTPLLDPYRDRFAVVPGDATTVPLEPILQGSGWVCASNLPYNVGTRILLRLLDLRDETGAPRLERLVLMLQKEVADRLVAPPGDRKRGSLSVAVQARAEARRCFRVPPGAFRPPPKVESAVVELRPRPQAPPPGLDDLLRRGFAAPRKTLRRNLGGDAGALARLDALGLSSTVRPAELDLDAWLAVYAG